MRCVRIKLHRLARSLCSALAGLAMPLQAQVTQNVEILGAPMGSNLAGTAPAVTVIRAEDLARAGVQTAEQALRRIAANQSSKGPSQGIGEITGGMAEADLRGLGPDKTLVLLNGRRLANHAYDAGAVDLNSIPLAAVERIEVLREGASAIYGSGAIAGVINFILRRDVQGLELSAGGDVPQSDGGGSTWLSLAAGYGDLATQGVNVSASLEWRRQQAIASADRPFAKSGVLRRPDGSLRQFRTGDTSFPGDLDGFEPSLAAGCAPPRSIPDLDGESCRYDFMRDIDLLPQTEQVMFLGQATFALAPRQTLALDYLHVQNTAFNRQGPTPVSMVLPDTSPYWIGGRPVTDFGALGSGGVANWLTAPAGRRSDQSRALAQRLLVSLQGEASGFDYQAAFTWSRSTVSNSLRGGHLSLDGIQQGLLDGRINPFGAQSAAGQAAFRSAGLSGKLVEAHGEVSSIDASIGRNLMSLGGGPLVASVGFELWRENFRYDLQPVAAITADPGLDLAIDTRGSRSARALFAQLQAPFSTAFTAGLAARIDRLGDSGQVNSTKLSLRWQPQAQWLVRGSLGTSFRAPTLYEIHQPAQLFSSSDSFDDPLLCPDGNAVPGVPANLVCEQQVLVRQAGSAADGASAAALRSEKSTSGLLGFVFQPSSRVLFGLDFWHIRLRNQIDELSENAVFDAPDRYASHLVRCSRLTAAERERIDSCLNSAGFDALAYVDTPIENLGNVKAQGIDLTLALNSGPGAYGELSFSLDGSYVARYDYQSESGGPYTRNAGRFANDVPIFRWQHVAQLAWMFGAWTTALSQRYLSGYTDQEPTRKVAPYALWDVSFEYTGLKNLSLGIGVKNILNRQPPFSNQDETLQSNYDPRFTDPLGRALMLRMVYRFD